MFIELQHHEDGSPILIDLNQIAFCEAGKTEPRSSDGGVWGIKEPISDALFEEHGFILLTHPDMGKIWVNPNKLKLVAEIVNSEENGYENSELTAIRFQESGFCTGVMESFESIKALLIKS